MIEFMLMSLHQLAAASTGIAGLELNPVEGKILAEALTKIQDHYGVRIAGEAMVWSNLAASLVAIYGPRFYVVREHLKGNAAKPVQPTPLQTVQQQPLN